MIFKIILILSLAKQICGSDDEFSDKFYQIQDQMLNGNYSQALDNLLGLLKEKPINLILHTNIAWCYYKLNNYQLAIKYADVALNSSDIYSRAIKIKVNALARLGRIKFFEGNYHEAELYLKQALELRPKDKQLAAYLALLFWSTEFFDKAADYALVALQQDKNFKLARIIYFKSLFRLGQIELFKNKNHDKAIDLIKHSLKFGPRNRQAYADLAYAYLMKQNFTECILNANKSLEYDVNNFNAKQYKASCLLKIALFYFENKNYNEFVFYLRQAFDLFVPDADMYAKYARLLKDIKFYEYAYELAERALQLDSKNEIAYQVKIESTNCLYNEWNFYSIYC